MDGVLFSSDKTDWRTPPDLFGRLNREFRFTLDAAASHENALCKRYFTEEDDGLARCWDGEFTFCNPPYGAMTDAWVKKASEIKRGVAVMLLAARTDTKRFHRWIYHQAEIRFIPSRVHFLRPDGTPAGAAPFPSMIVIYHHLWKER